MATPHKKLKDLATTARSLILRSTTAAGTGHPSSSLSATDLMTTLMFGGFFHADIDDPQNPLNDRLIFSKGHAAPLLYALYTMAHKVAEADLLKLRQFGSPLEGHPTMQFPYTEAATGSLGQGLSIGVGMAINGKYLDQVSYRTFVLLGDSEMAEGSVWEAFQLAEHYKLHNLVAILDLNRLGQRGETMYGHNEKVYLRHAEAFGWRVYVIDGHDYEEIAQCYGDALREKEKPVLIIAKTIKGKGVSFIENKLGWHGRALTTEECKLALAELGDVQQSLRGVIFKPPHEDIQKYGGEIHTVETVYNLGDKVATRKAYGENLVALFQKHQNMVVLDAEVSNSTHADIFQKAYPERFFEMFIAEQNMVGAALGLSRRGKLPFVSTFAAFFTRAADQIRMSQYSKSNIKFVGSHAGVSIGEDGASQMGLEDIALFRSLLGAAVFYPADAVAVSKIMQLAADYVGNVYIRTTRKETPVIYKSTETFVVGGSKTLKTSERDFVTVVGAGVTLFEALKAYDILVKEGKFIRVIDLYSIKPLDLVTLKKAASETRAIVTVEDHYEAGGIGEAVAGALSATGAIVHRLAVQKMPRSGKPDELLAYEGINAASIIQKVKSII